MKVYLSGPMSGRPEYNFPAFHAAAGRLRSVGFEVVSPAELDGDPPAGVIPGDSTYNAYLARDVQIVADPTVGAVAVLDGWEESTGARLEVTVAHRLGKMVWKFAPTRSVLPVERLDKLAVERVIGGKPKTENVLQEADRIVGGDRGEDYGHPFHDFSRTAAMATALLGQEIRPDQVPLLMIAVKLSRQANRPKRDNLVDIAGYARTAEMVAEFEAVA